MGGSGRDIDWIPEMGSIWVALLVRCEVHGPGVFDGKGETFGRWGWGADLLLLLLSHIEGLGRLLYILRPTIT